MSNFDHQQPPTTTGPEKVWRAGMVVYRVIPEELLPDDFDDSDIPIEMMFMRPADTTHVPDVFQLAKGRVETGETYEQAALREAEEELGLLAGMIINGPELIGTFMGRTVVYICRVPYDAVFGGPDEETRETAWMSMFTFIREGRSLHVPVVKEAYRKILEIEGFGEYID